MSLHPGMSADLAPRGDCAFPIGPCDECWGCPGSSMGIAVSTFSPSQSGSLVILSFPNSFPPSPRLAVCAV